MGVKKNKRGLLVGMTGGIASGKSTVSTILKAKGIPVIDADEINRSIWEDRPENKSTIAQIQKLFGTTDKVEIRNRSFQDPGLKMKLESILHPEIRIRSKTLIDEKFALGNELVVYDASLLLESGEKSFVDYILVISCSIDDQLHRIRLRNPEWGHETAFNAICSQMPLQEKVKHADYVIENSSSLGDLEAKVQEWLGKVNLKHSD